MSTAIKAHEECAALGMNVAATVSFTVPQVLAVGAAVSESDITQAGIACLKKAYRIFNERGYDTYLMPAGCRGANQIIELAGAKMIFSIAPKRCCGWLRPMRRKRSARSMMRRTVRTAMRLDS